MSGCRASPRGRSERFAAEEPAPDIEKEKPDRRRLEDEDGPLLDRADGQGDEDEDRAQSPEDDVVDQFVPLGGII